MTLLEALRATTGARTLARPVSGLRDGCGYYVQSNRVWWYDKTELGPNFLPRVVIASWWPPFDVVSGEWEVVGR